jgi:hypothetical protein
MLASKRIGVTIGDRNYNIEISQRRRLEGSHFVRLASPEHAQQRMACYASVAGEDL